jgi:hypothetical protein
VNGPLDENVEPGASKTNSSASENHNKPGSDSIENAFLVLGERQMAALGKSDIGRRQPVNRMTVFVFVQLDTFGEMVDVIVFSSSHESQEQKYAPPLAFDHGPPS